MKKILLCICLLGLSLYAENSCDKYLEQADKIRLEVEKALSTNSVLNSREALILYIKYIEILQDRYSICYKMGNNECKFWKPY